MTRKQKSAREKGRYTTIFLNILDSPEYRKLSPQAALVWWALKLDPNLHQLGVMPWFRETLSERAKVPLVGIDAAMDELVRDGWIVLDEDRRWVWIRNHLTFDRHYDPTNSKNRVGLLRKICALPATPLVKMACAYCANKGLLPVANLIESGYLVANDALLGSASSLPGSETGPLLGSAPVENSATTERKEELALQAAEDKTLKDAEMSAAEALLSSAPTKTVTKPYTYTNVLGENYVLSSGRKGSTPSTAPGGWSGEAGLLWGEYLGVPPWKRIGTALKPLILVHGWDVVKPIWAAYVKAAAMGGTPEMAVPETFARTFVVRLRRAGLATTAPATGRPAAVVAEPPEPDAISAWARVLGTLEGRPVYEYLRVLDPIRIDGDDFHLRAPEMSARIVGRIIEIHKREVDEVLSLSGLEGKVLRIRSVQPDQPAPSRGFAGV